MFFCLTQLQYFVSCKWILTYMPFQMFLEVCLVVIIFLTLYNPRLDFINLWLWICPTNISTDISTSLDSKFLIAIVTTFHQIPVSQVFSDFFSVLMCIHESSFMFTIGLVESHILNPGTQLYHGDITLSWNSSLP